jgi:hypothetical protein
MGEKRNFLICNKNHDNRIVGYATDGKNKILYCCKEERSFMKRNKFLISPPKPTAILPPLPTLYFYIAGTMAVGFSKYHKGYLSMSSAKAVKLGSKLAWACYHRGFAYGKPGNY